jgi:hypothetical protein
MRNSLEVLVPDGRYIGQFHSTVKRLGVYGAAIDGDMMPALNQSDREFFGKRFEPPIAGWDAPGSQQSDAHTGRQSGPRQPAGALRDCILALHRIGYSRCDVRARALRCSAKRRGFRRGGRGLATRFAIVCHTDMYPIFSPAHRRIHDEGEKGEHENSDNESESVQGLSS